MKNAQQNQSQMSEAALWQGKYDAKVQEVAALRAQINKQEAIIAALVLDNAPDTKQMTFAEETIQFIADGGVAGFNRELLDDGSVMLEVILSPDAEEVEEDDADVDEAGTEDAEDGEGDEPDPDDS